MFRYFIFFITLFLASCSTSYLEETQDLIDIKTVVSYDLSVEGIDLTWESQWDFAYINITRSTDPKNMQLYRSNIVQTKLLDTDMFPGKDYFYQINAYNSKKRLIGKSQIIKGKRSFKDIANVKTPSQLITYPESYTDQIEIFWNGDPDGVFRVYRKNALNTSDQFIVLEDVYIGSKQELMYRDKNVDPGESYIYKLSALGKDDQGNIKEIFASSTVEGKTKDAPKGLFASYQNQQFIGAIVLIWKKETQADYYRVYRSSEEKGTYDLIADNVRLERYVDRSLPNLEAVLSDGAYKYPNYYYKIQYVKGSSVSGFSDFAMGQAINPKDFFSAPNNFALELRKTSYPYQINLSWDDINQLNAYYRILKINNNVTNIVADNINDTQITIPNEEFNTYWEYIVQAVNSQTGLLGQSSKIVYNSTTPAPPTIQTITTNIRYYTTNIVYNSDETDKFVYSHVYWGSDTSMVGITKKEWHITSEVGMIDLTWEMPNDNEIPSYYNIYRRKSGDSEFELIKSQVTATSYQDRDFTENQYQGIGTGTSFAYPMYEYHIIAVCQAQESMPSLPEFGSAINPKDILPAPSYVTVPGHWADGNGFGSAKWKKGPLSPKGAEKIEGQGGRGNHMYLVWDSVSQTDTYQVRHSRGSLQESWYSHTLTKAEYLWIDNNTTSESMTGLYVFTDWLGYSKENASFDVSSVNVNANNLPGDTRGIWFEEPDTKPDHY